MKKIIYILLMIVLFVGCNGEDDTCRKPKKVNCKISFFLDTINTKTGNLDKLKRAVDSLWVKGVGIDKYLYKNKKGLSEIILPLNKFQKKSTFAITINTYVDTIEIVHKNLNEYLSLNCGTIRTYEIDTVYSTKHFIDTILIKNKKVNTFNVEHLQIHHIK